MWNRLRGGAQVFFHKSASKVEVLNDLDSEIVNFFRVCQWHYEELIRYLHFCPISRNWHKTLLQTKPENLTDIQRAGRFFYLQKNSFGGLVVKQRFHYGVAQPPNYNPRRIAEIIRQTHERLRGAQIESLPYERILEKYDRPTTLFYLDPPYYQRFLYKYNLEDDEFRLMAERLRQVSGKFILSLNDHPDVRKIFSEFSMRTASIAYTAQRKVGNRYVELLITNFKAANA